MGTNELPIIGLVPFSNILSVPRSLDIAPLVNGTWLHEGEAKQRRILPVWLHRILNLNYKNLLLVN